MLGLPPELYAAELGRMKAEAAEAAGELLADPAWASLVDGLGPRCKEADVRPSMGSVGDAYDNAMAECEPDGHNGFVLTSERITGRRE